MSKSLTLTSLALALLTTPASAQARSITTRLNLVPGAVDSASLTMAGFDRNHTPGQPALARRELSVALHPMADLRTLQLNIAEGPTDTLPGRHQLAPNPAARVMYQGQVDLHWGQAGTIVKGRDLAAYGARIFPRQVVTRGRVSDRRGLLVLRLAYTPLRYRHATGELLLQRQTRVSLSYTLLPGRAALDPQHQAHLTELANLEQARTWYAPPPPAPGPQPAKAKMGYVIMIRDVLAKKSKQLAAFVKHKQAMGFSVTVVGDKQLTAISVGPAGGDAERMRFWLQKNYKALDLRYLLIIGNPDPSRPGVPMKNTYAYAKNTTYPTIAPSDYYYADLTGNWDLDGDGKVGEYPDDKGTGGVDFAPEVYVGRIPIYDDNATVLDRILLKTMRYATDAGDRSWRKRVLQPAAMIFYDNQYGKKHLRIDGATMARAINDKCIKPNGFTSTTLYEEDGVDPSKLKGDIPLTRDNVVKEWRKGYGLVTWFGHGSPDAVVRTIWAKDDGDKVPEYGEISSPDFLTFDDVLKLNDARPSFVFHGSCSNGTPEKPYNIGYGLLLNGAVGTVSSTRIAVVLLGASYEASKANIFGVEMDFTDALLKGKPVGEALFEAKQKVYEQLGMLTWFTRMEISLYGDPSLTITSCTSAADCDDSKACNGKERCAAGQCLAGKAVSCSSADPCTEALCDEKTGACVKQPRPEGEACDDGKFCTADERCAAGACVGRARCAIKDNPCVASTCDETARSCSVTAATAGQVCRAGTEREGQCQAGVCHPDDDGGCAVPGRIPPPGWGLALLAMLVALNRRRR